MKKLLFIAGFLLLSLSSVAQTSIEWLRYPSISPNGEKIAFSYMGNIYVVSADGGMATPLTVSKAYEKRPVWSPDGDTIAFSSDRYGNFDIFTIPTSGGKANRITFHSSPDYAYDFAPDGSTILMGSLREGPASSVRFPGVSYFERLYSIPVEGGRPYLITAAGAENAHYNPTGTKIVFQDKKGYEDYYRKHHKSPITRDIWTYNIKKDNYTKITSFKGENRVPSFSASGGAIFYTNEKSGDLNVYKRSLTTKEETQLTDFEDFPVRSLSVSNQNKMAFSWKGSIYTLAEGLPPEKLTIKISNEAGYNPIKDIDISSVTDFKVNPNGKEIAFVNRGEVFVTGIDGSYTKRITNTSQQERMIAWSPDGNTLLYSGERNGSWNIYKVTLKRPKEEFFYASTVLNTEKIIGTEAEEFQPKFSPDGKKIAYVYNRNVLKVYDIESGEKTVILPEGRNHSYSDGDWSFSWSPDSKWLLVDDQKGYMFRSNTALIAADGAGEIVHPVNSGFGDYNAKWALDGKMMTYKSSKLGRRSLAQQGSKETDIYAVFFDQKAYDKYTLSKNEFELRKQRKKAEEKKKKEDKKEDEEEDKDEEKTEPLELNLKDLEERKVRLTINSASISDYVLNKDASKLYYLAAFQKGYNLWVTEPRTHETKILAKLNGSPSDLQISEDGKTLYLSNHGHLMKVNTKSGKVEKIGVSADMSLNKQKERRYIFNHIWRQVKDKFYDPNIHGIDWKIYHDVYAKFLPHINNNYDFTILLSEMLGELNASHTGARYYPQFESSQNTASLGILVDQNYRGKGIKIIEIIDEGPLDNAESDVQKGDIIVRINNDTISENQNWYPLLTNITGKNTLLTIQKNGEETIQTTIKPVSLGKERNLMYERWVDTMQRMTDSLSNGKLGYVHIRGMNDYSFRQVYDRVMGELIGKEALIVDTRFNGGGWLHNDLNTFLSGDLYLKFSPQGDTVKGGEPSNRWKKPSVVIMSEGNYSDAYIFPYIYKQNDIGKLVGMPVAGTGTAVWWEQQIDPTIVFGIPMIATIGEEGRPTENMTLYPDIKVRLLYNEVLEGQDAQLKAAVQTMLKEISDGGEK